MEAKDERLQEIFFLAQKISASISVRQKNGEVIVGTVKGHTFSCRTGRYVKIQQAIKEGEKVNREKEINYSDISSVTFEV
ncbi:MAG: hypothetical protein WC663_00605 [Patescibacteria group bacterium]|jgi:hypothetical protein